MTRNYSGTPYTYLIGWSKQNKFYYGVRYARNCDPSELWVTYKTSSKHVKNFISKHGNPDIIQIRKTFNTPDAARLWEHKVLRRLKVTSNDKYINQTDNISIQNSPEHYEYMAYYNSIVQKGKSRNFTKQDLERRSILRTTQNLKTSRIGHNNGRFKSDVFTFYNTVTNESFDGTRYDFIKKFNLNQGNVSNVINGKVLHHKNWIRIR